MMSGCPGCGRYRDQVWSSTVAPLVLCDAVQSVNDRGRKSLLERFELAKSALVTRLATRRVFFCFFLAATMAGGRVRLFVRGGEP